MSDRSKDLIRELNLKKHPEGGYYRETFRSSLKIKSPTTNKIYNALTDIYFLLLENSISRFHRIKHDEVWHFYEGAPLILFEFNSKENILKKHIIGKLKKTDYKVVIKADNWQAAYSTGMYSLVGCTVAPGFAFKDFEMIKDVKEDKEKLLNSYPELSTLI